MPNPRYYPTPEEKAARNKEEFPGAVRRHEKARREADECRLDLALLGLGQCHDPAPDGLPIPGATYAEVVAAALDRDRHWLM